MGTSASLASYLAEDSAGCYTSRMDKTKLLEWMKKMEALSTCAFPWDAEAKNLALREAVVAREAFATDANCASMKDPPDDPPPPLSPPRSAAWAMGRKDLLDEIIRRAITDGMGGDVAQWLEEGFNVREESRAEDSAAIIRSRTVIEVVDVLQAEVDRRSLSVCTRDDAELIRWYTHAINDIKARFGA